jgi:EPS-associated MarR family transcriptional regulator
MAGRRNDLQEEAKFRVMRLVLHNPNISTRELADLAGISNGSAFYLIKAFIEKGFVKLQNFSSSPKKSKYTYILTPKGIKEKAKLTVNFLERKRYEFYKLEHEIKEVEIEASLSQEAKKV